MIQKVYHRSVLTNEQIMIITRWLAIDGDSDILDVKRILTRQGRMKKISGICSHTTMPCKVNVITLIYLQTL